MTAIRHNILSDTTARNQFVDGVLALDQEMSGIYAADLYAYLQRNSIPVRFFGRNQQLSTYDLFVFWHVMAMSITMPPGNAAHSGPVFLPWHRMYLLRLEQEIQRVSNNREFGLPYWDWAADGERPRDAQWRTNLWSDAIMGPARGSVSRGRLSAMRVRLWQDTRTGTLYSIEPRRLSRQAGMDSRNRWLPNRAWERYAVNQRVYDVRPWNQSTTSHRNVLEGWLFGPQLHNLVHVWVGGDMAPGTSPNDPVFFLNHCNVDRIWEIWMSQRGRIYRPTASEGTVGHRLNDAMVALVGDPMTPSQVLDLGRFYSYDRLSVS